MHTRYKTFIDMAQTSYFRADYKQAIMYAINSLKYDKIALDSHFLLGMCYNKIEDFKNAVEHFETYMMSISFDIRYMKMIRDNWFGNHIQLFEANYFCAHCYYELQNYEKAAILYNQCVNKFSFEGKDDPIHSELQSLAKFMAQSIVDEHKIYEETEEPVIFIEKSFICIACSDESRSNLFKNKFQEQYHVIVVNNLSDLAIKNKENEYIKVSINIIIDIDYNEEMICSCTKTLSEYSHKPITLLFSDKINKSNLTDCAIDSYYPLTPDFVLIFSNIVKIHQERYKLDNSYDSFLKMLYDD